MCGVVEHEVDGVREMFRHARGKSQIRLRQVGGHRAEAVRRWLREQIPAGGVFDTAQRLVLVGGTHQTVHRHVRGAHQPVQQEGTEKSGGTGQQHLTSSCAERERRPCALGVGGARGENQLRVLLEVRESRRRRRGGCCVHGCAVGGQGGCREQLP
ncbi:hypothetical protein IHE61_22275 [Streptomyces sp. GKU 257-1]|nr:hypothetical protein [Streptomyces sp. GKU 257-1]